jgi:hypothetical protein
MELATCRYIDFPSVGIINLEVPQLPEKVLEVATEWMFAEPSILEMIASVSKALHKYERTGSFAPAAGDGGSGSRGARSRHGVGCRCDRATTDQ